MKRIIPIILILITLITLAACATQPTTPTTPKTPSTDTPTQAELAKIDYCDTDADCVCGGIDKNTNQCFLGSKDYYDKYVDKTKTCPDFCTGIAGNLAVKCVDSKCMQLYECLTDADCDSGEKCTANKCVSSATTTSPEPAPAPSGTECKSDSGCRTGGCSGQLCESVSAEPRMTTCEYRMEYNCLKLVKCGCIDGRCSWSTSAEYEKCVDDAKSEPVVIRE